MTMHDSTTRFPRVRHGYDPASVDEYVNEIGLIQRSLQQEVDSLRAQLHDSSTQIAMLTEQTAALSESSPTPQAMTDRIAKMLSHRGRRSLRDAVRSPLGGRAIAGQRAIRS